MDPPPHRPRRSYVGRAGDKLEAALEAFRLGERVAGARAIDVGSSTGGFVQCLLTHGAAGVVAIDVGHGQLHPELRADPRVELHEGVHFKHAPLTLAAGPFDFFTVDVSFVAARTMLRPLAFRLRAGAEGVILVKPQFELPEGYLRGGQVRAEGLRDWALRRVVERAGSLGFELVTAVDSPVPGGEGTVEILSHWRFVARGERMPAPPDAARAASPSAVSSPRGPRAVALEGALELFAVAAPGLEPVVAREVEALPGAAGVTEVEGGVAFSGEAGTLLSANLRLRSATRVLLRVGELRAREFAELVSRARELPWERFFHAPPERVEVSAHASRLYHTGAVAERLERAVAERLARRRRGASAAAGAAAGPAGAAGQAPRLYARGVRDRWTLSVDASGELLHRRGYREEQVRAPLRETLAAALLMLCGWRPELSLCDPMCGSGTVAIEAALMALGVAPGLGRRFAFESWPAFAPLAGGWDALRGEAEATAVRARAAAPPALILAADRSAAAVARAERNAGRAGVGAAIRFAVAPLEALELPPGTPPGLVVCNPPYGRRLAMGGASPAAAVAALGEALHRRFPGWSAGVLLPEAGLARSLGLPIEATHTLAHGGLRVTLVRARLSPDGGGGGARARASRRPARGRTR